MKSQSTATRFTSVEFWLKTFFKNQENIKIVKDAMYSSTNEPGDFLWLN